MQSRVGIGRPAFVNRFNKRRHHYKMVAVLGGTIAGDRQKLIFDRAIFDFIHVLSTHLDAAVFGNHRYAALQALVPYRRFKANATHTPVFKLEMYPACIFKSSEMIVVHSGKAGMNVLDTAK